MYHVMVFLVLLLLSLLLPSGDSYEGLAHMEVFPWNVYIKYQRNYVKIGVLIDEKWVLTSAMGLENGVESLHLGQCDTASYLELSPKEIIMHDDFSIMAESSRNDIALIRLPDVDLREYQKVHLPYNRKCSANDILYMISVSSTLSVALYPHHVYAERIAVAPHEKCARNDEFIEMNPKLSFDNNTRLEQILIKKDKNVFYVMGIGSLSNHTFGEYYEKKIVNVKHYLTWIQNVIGNKY